MGSGGALTRAPAPLTAPPRNSRALGRDREGKVADVDGVTRVPVPYNEPVRQYQPDSADRAVLAARIKELAGERAELTMTIGGRRVMGSGERVPVVQPHNFRHVLGEFGNATDADV